MSLTKPVDVNTLLPLPCSKQQDPNVANGYGVMPWANAKCNFGQFHSSEKHNNGSVELTRLP